MKFYFFICAFALGILAAFAYSLPFSFALFLAVLGGALLVYLKLVRVQISAIALCALVCIGFGLGSGRMSYAERVVPDPLASLAGSKAELSGVVAEDPDLRESYTQLVVAVEGADISGREVSLAGTSEKIIARVPINSHFKYGDLVSVSGTLEKPENFETDSGRTFDYVNYLAKDGITYEIGFAQAKLISSGHGNPVQAALFSFKHEIEQAVSAAIPAPQSSLENGILLGAKQSISQNILDDFQLASLSHIVVLSGYNVSIVSQIVFRLLSFLPNIVSGLAGALSIVLFSLMAGSGASVVRAAVMALIALLARITRREYDAFRALMLAAFGMALLNPRIVTSDPSFQLSFLATIGIIAVTPLVERHFKFVPERHGIREAIVTTLSTQLFILPFLLYMSGILSISGFPANALILPVVPITMLFGAITASLAFISNWLAMVPAFVSYGLLTYILSLSHFFAHIPFGTFSIKHFPLWAVAIWYAVYAYILLRWHRSRPKEQKEKAVQKFDTSLAFEIVEWP